MLLRSEYGGKTCFQVSSFFCRTPDSPFHWGRGVSVLLHFPTNVSTGVPWAFCKISGNIGVRIRKERGEAIVLHARVNVFRGRLGTRTFAIFPNLSKACVFKGPWVLPSTAFQAIFPLQMLTKDDDWWLLYSFVWLFTTEN